MSMPSPEDLLLAREDDEVLHRALERLPARYERAIRLWYGIGCERQTLREIGRQYGLSGSMIGAIIAKGARKLAEASNPLRNHFRGRFPSIAREDRQRREDAIAAVAERKREQPGIDHVYLAFVRERQRYAERLHAEAMAEAKAARRPKWEVPDFVPAYGIIRGFDRRLMQQTEAYRARMSALCLPYQVRHG
jgi:hypothetical protein